VYFWTVYLAPLDLTEVGVVQTLLVRMLYTVTSARVPFVPRPIRYFLVLYVTVNRSRRHIYVHGWREQRTLVVLYLAHGHGEARMLHRVLRHRVVTLRMLHE